MLPLNNNTYDLVKKFVQVVLPALATLYAGLAALWNFPYTTGVVGTMTLLATFLGIALGLSSSLYNKSDSSVEDDTLDASLIVSTVDGEKFLTLGFKDQNVEAMLAKPVIRLDVVHNTEAAEHS